MPIEKASQNEVYRVTSHKSVPIHLKFIFEPYEHDGYSWQVVVSILIPGQLIIFLH